MRRAVHFKFHELDGTKISDQDTTYSKEYTVVPQQLKAEVVHMLHLAQEHIANGIMCLITVHGGSCIRGKS
jgi:hypothetical protein